jgi:hypothetical protein
VLAEQGDSPVVTPALSGAAAAPSASVGVGAGGAFIAAITASMAVRMGTYTSASRENPSVSCALASSSDCGLRTQTHSRKLTPASAALSLSTAVLVYGGRCFPQQRQPRMIEADLESRTLAIDSIAAASLVPICTQQGEAEYCVSRAQARV